MRRVSGGPEQNVFFVKFTYVNLNSHMWLLISLFEIILISDVILTTCFIEGRKGDRSREMGREGGGVRQNRIIYF